MFPILVAFCLALTAYVVHKIWLSKPKNLPPQPPGYPVVGNLPMLTSNPPQKLLEWSQQLGPTVAVWFGPILQVVVHDYDTAKKVFSEENTTRQDKSFILSKLLSTNAFADGEKWHQHRRFMLSTLRDLGMGKTWLQESILAEVNDLLTIYAAQNGQAYNPKPHLTLSVSNVISALEFGKRFDHSDARFLRMAEFVGESLVLLEKAVPASAFPFLQYVPGQVRQACQRFRDIDVELNKFMEEIMAEHTDPSASENANFIDRYRMETSKNPSETNSTFSEYMLQGTLLGLFNAGTDTTTLTLSWGMIYMVENPDVLRKVQKEIDEKVGRQTPITMAEKALLTYTEAVLLEIQRLASIVPLSIPHTNFEAMQIDGYDIPAHTILTINSYAMHRDPRYWKHPNQFYPEHFLAEDGSVVIPKSFAPFGIGKRACVGESLAKMSLFLFFTNLVQRFDLQCDPDSPLSSDNCIVGFVRTPSPFRLRLIQRN